MMEIKSIVDFMYEFRSGRNGRNREFPNFHDGNYVHYGL